MKNKILFVNGGTKEFGNRFREACLDNEIGCVSIRTHNNSFIVAETSGCRYFHLGEEIKIKDFDYAFIRVRGKYSHMTALFAYILKNNNITFNDINNIEHTMNDEKITQMVKFSSNNLPIPKTVIFSNASYKKNKDKISEHFSFPCVLKTNGSKGEAVWKINNIEELEIKLNEINNELVLLQEYIKNDHDIRALFFKEELMAAIRRYSGDGFYNNVSKGGRTEVTELSEEEISLSQKGMNILDLDFGGVGFIRTDNGIMFLEINKGPMVYGLENITRLDVPRELVKKIKNNYL